MLAKRFTDSRKWQDPWFRKLPYPYRELWIYILDTCDHAGIWKKDFDLAEFCLGSNIEEETVRELFGDRLVEISSEKWFVPKFISFQYGGLNDKVKAHESVLEILKKERVSEGLYKGYLTIKDKDKDKDKDVVVSQVHKSIDVHPTEVLKEIERAARARGVDWDDEMKKMDIWLAKNHKRKKTDRFIANWMQRADVVVGGKPARRVVS